MKKPLSSGYNLWLQFGILVVLVFVGNNLFAQKWEIELSPEVGFVHQYPVGEFYNLRDVQLSRHTIRPDSYEKFYLLPSLGLSGNYTLNRFFTVGAHLKHGRSDLVEIASFDHSHVENQRTMITYSTRFVNWQTGVSGSFQLRNSSGRRWFLKLAYTLNYLSWPQIFESSKECSGCAEYSSYQKNERSSLSSGFQVASGYKWTLNENYLLGFGFNFDYLIFSPDAMEVVKFEENGQDRLSELPSSAKNFEFIENADESGSIANGVTYLRREEYRFATYALFLSLGYKF